MTALDYAQAMRLPLCDDSQERKTEATCQH